MSKYRSFIGIPFVDKGRDASGCDCWGLVRLVYFAQKKIVLPEYAEISCEDLERVNEALENGSNSEVWRKLEDGEEIREFDIVGMNAHGKPRGENYHVGVMINSSQMIHAERLADSHLASISDNRIASRINGFYRFKELEQFS